MRDFLILFFCGLCSLLTVSQEYVEDPVNDLNAANRFSQFRIEHPLGVNGEAFYNGAAEYQLFGSLGARLENFYSRFGTHEQFNTSVLFKWYVSDKLNFYGGPETEYGTNELTGETELLRVNLNLGVGYEVQPDFLLELGYHPEIGKPNEDLWGRQPKKQNSFSLRARF